MTTVHLFVLILDQRCLAKLNLELYREGSDGECSSMPPQKPGADQEDILKESNRVFHLFLPISPFDMGWTQVMLQLLLGNHVLSMYSWKSGDMETKCLLREGYGGRCCYHFLMVSHQDGVAGDSTVRVRREVYVIAEHRHCRRGWAQ